jgi:putative ABC transport system permease protein
MTPGFDATSLASGGLDFSLMQMALYGLFILVGLLGLGGLLAVLSLPIFFGSMFGLELGFRLTDNLPDPFGKNSKLAGLVFRSLRRNLLRTALSYVALFVLTFMLTMIYSIVRYLGELTTDKEGTQLVLLTEKYSIPSQMPPGHGISLKAILEEKLPSEHRPKVVADNYMTWSFVGATLDNNKITPENSFFLFALDPRAIETGMMKEQGLNPEDVGEKDWAQLLEVMALIKEDKRRIVIGEDRLQKMNKRVGERIKFYSTNYKDLEFECEIVGAFPATSRLSGAAAMRFDYLQSKLDEFKATKGTPHPQADKCVNLVWLRLPSKEAFEQLAAIVNKDSSFSPPVKLETFSAAIGSFLEPLKEILWGTKRILMPAIFVVMCVVIGITITISVRERWVEMAVLKVLGFQPWQVITMIVSEAVLIGVFGGMLSTWLVYFLPKIVKLINKATGGSNFLANITPYYDILYYGPAIGIFIGLVGAVIPAWSARKIKVSEVFSQVS